MMPVGGDTAFWLVLLGLTFLAAGQFVRGRQRRVAINQALHEIRRPLQSLALADRGPAGRELATPASGAVWQAIRAVRELDQEVNGGPCPEEPKDLVACRLLSDACIRRCGPRARLAGASIQLRWAGPDALIRGDGAALGAAIENLLLNAIEHGGPEITVNAVTIAKRLRIEVIDSGNRSGARSGLRTEPLSAARTSAALRHGLGFSRLRSAPLRRGSDRRHGHGLRVARRAAEVHGGRLSVEITERGSRAALVLPVGESGAPR